MRLQDQNDYTTLTWVKPEIDETLKLARQGLEDYVENGQDRAQLELCANGLAQVHCAWSSSTARRWSRRKCTRWPRR